MSKENGDTFADEREGERGEERGRSMKRFYSENSGRVLEPVLKSMFSHTHTHTLMHVTVSWIQPTQIPCSVQPQSPSQRSNKRQKVMRGHRSIPSFQNWSSTHLVSCCCKASDSTHSPLMNLLMFHGVCV